jgi:tubulin polyglutamylase TTLL9
MWCEKEQVDWVFEKHRVAISSKVNHFRGWYELCRKDMLNKNLKKFKRNLDKQGNLEESNQYDFLPVTYLMPSEYVIFYD